jgi:hypothetical protein
MAKKYSLHFALFSFLLLLPSSLLLSQQAIITIWKDSAMGAIYNQATLTVAYSKPDKKGTYHIYLSDTLGNNEIQISYAGWRTDRQQWAEEWMPDGKYIFCYVEKDEYVKEKIHKRKPVDACPGYGAYCDLWAMTPDGKKAWKVVDLPNSYNSGIIHSAISPDGKMFAWSERVKAPNLSFNTGAGCYVIRVADITVDSCPHFSNIRTFQPGGVDASTELDGICPGDSVITFYSTFESKNILATPIYKINILTGKITKLTTASFSQAGTFTPDGKHIVYMTGDSCDRFPGQLQGADWWIMNTDGSGKRRLTFMNKKGNAQCDDHYRLAGTVSFMRNDCFLGGVMTKSFGLVGYTAKVTFTYPDELKTIDQQYNDCITAGNTFFANKNYTDARKQYEKASALKPGEQYPKDRIAECDLLMKK